MLCRCRYERHRVRLDHEEPRFPAATGVSRHADRRHRPDILAEYEEVLCRKKFHLQVETVRTVVDAIRQFGIEVQPKPTGEILIDMDDLVFYEVAMEKRDDGAYLGTGNQKHYPVRNFIVPPAEMIEILKK